MNLVVFVIAFLVTGSLGNVDGKYLPVLLFGIAVLVRRFVRLQRLSRERGEELKGGGCVEWGLLMSLIPLTGKEFAELDLHPLALVLGAVLVAVLVLVALLAWRGYVTVPPGHVGIVSRIRGASDPEFRHITPHDTRGILARTLLPDRSRWLMPLTYEVEFVPRTEVAEGKIGVVTAKAGRTRPANRAVARSVACDHFQDGQAFLLGGGEQGKQVDTLAHGQTYDINTRLFEVEQVDRVLVPKGTIGLVSARTGGNRPTVSTFGPHVECDNFQDGARFLEGGGAQGTQLAVLKGDASYDINPALFNVITTDNAYQNGQGLMPYHLNQVYIPPGYTGVVITLDGAEQESSDRLGPRVPGHQGFQLPWVFLQNGGWRGVQEETLREGTRCDLNPYFVYVVLIPTRILVLEWNDKTPEESRNYDVHLERIVVTVQGYRLFVEMSQTLQIRPESAPTLVSRNGTRDLAALGGLDTDPVPVQRFVERVLGALVVSYFSGIAAASTIKEFLETYAETRTDLSAQVKRALNEWGVDARGTTLGEFRAEDPMLNEELKRPAHEQLQGEVLDLQLANAEREDAIDQVRVEAEKRRLRMDIEAQVAVLGLENHMVLEAFKTAAAAPVPQIISGSDLSAYLETLPMARLAEVFSMMKGLMGEAAVEPGAPPPPSLPQGETSGDAPGEGGTPPAPAG
ncbi:SPFH domain-containing protein [Streptomyces sp. NPDC002454]